MSTSYLEFLDRKTGLDRDTGFEPRDLSPRLFDFQAELVRWACSRGRAAVWADCGLGKGLMQLEWARQVRERTGGNVLILAPLAVAAQTVREGEKFGIEARRSHAGEFAPGITVANYERLHLFNPEDFSGMVCDESSILKSFNGTRRGEITTFMRKLPYRLLCTATAAPNDYIELGTSSEALGYLGYMDMLNRFFKNDQNNSASGRKYGEMIKWRLKGHAEDPFWRWVCSWARAVRKPSDLGFEDRGFVLPELIEREHLVSVPALRTGKLFELPAVGLKEQREELRASITERCERVAELVAHDRPALVWCHANAEGDLLERIIPGAVQVSGSDSDEEKERRFLSFIDGTTRVLVTKPKIAGFGLNFQHCTDMTWFPSHSFEQYYQGIRRCWRFPQQRPVTVNIVATEGQRGILENVQRKARQADEMFAKLVSLMNAHLHIPRDSRFTKQEVIPSWL